MAGRATYTDEQKAQVYVVLAANDGNVKRTVRDTGVPSATIRRWRADWDRGNVPRVEDIEAASGDFLNKAETIRWKALVALEDQLRDAKPGDLIKIVGILDDKITRARGMADRTVEHRHMLPSADELHALVVGFAEATREAALVRSGDIIDAEIVEQPRRGLPSG